MFNLWLRFWHGEHKLLFLAYLIGILPEEHLQFLIEVLLAIPAPNPVPGSPGEHGDNLIPLVDALEPTQVSTDHQAIILGHIYVIDIGVRMQDYSKFR